MDRTVSDIREKERPLLENGSGLVCGPQGLRDAGRPALDPEYHERILATCGDVPEERPSFPIGLTEVGITGKTVWVDLPQGRIPFDTTITVNLPSEIRGIHMSRMEEAISLLYDERFPDPAAYAEILAERVAASQCGDRVSVRLKGSIPILRRTSVTRRSSVDSVGISAMSQLNGKGERIRTRIGLGIFHITACPCTQAYNLAISSEETDLPLPTHSQRSETWMEVETNAGRPGYSDLLECLEKALHVTQDLLKRPDEAEIVLKSHCLPQFAEDVVREVAREAGIRFGLTLPASTPVAIETRSLESIHIHDVRCRLETTISDVLAVIETTDNSTFHP